MTMSVLLTGSAGFIGSHLLRHLLEKTTHTVISVDCLSYASDTDTISDLMDHPRHSFVLGNICDKKLMDRLVMQCDGIIHLAAESHVDRSIDDSSPFIHTNILGTQILLDAAVKFKTKRFLYLSTDEVYGDLPNKGQFHESLPLCPSSPYSASKAAADLMVSAWHRTYGLPTIISRCTNNLGTHQHPEKFIPRLILNALHDLPLPIYGSGLQVRDWIDVRDHCRALVWLFQAGQTGESYNIGAEQELTNLKLAKSILQLIPNSNSKIIHIKDRPGHDLRYANSVKKLKCASNWQPEYHIKQSLEEIVQWTKENSHWWAPRWTEKK